MPEFFRFSFIFLLSTAAVGQVSTASIVAPFTVCTGVPVTFSLSSSDSLTTARAYTWSILPSNPLLIGENTGTTVTYSFSNPGTYHVNLRMEPGPDTTFLVTTKIITVSRTAHAAFNASLSSAGYPNELVLTNYSTNSLRNYWFFDNDTKPDSSFHLVKDYPESGTYTVTLVAIGRNGCDNISTYTFSISNTSGITLPNIFSPNNDGVNDIYRPITRGISRLNARIFNRYGVTIANWDRVNGFWDGRTTTGEPCDEGVYFIILEATGFDSKAYKERGPITLVR